MQNQIMQTEYAVFYFTNGQPNNTKTIPVSSKIKNLKIPERTINCFIKPRNFDYKINTDGNVILNCYYLLGTLY